MDMFSRIFMDKIFGMFSLMKILAEPLVWESFVGF